MTQVTGPEQQPEAKGLVGQAGSWVDHRAATGDLWRVFFDRKVPLGVGWLYTLGAASLFVFTLQTVTGIILAMHYSPSPDHAHASIQFIMNDVPFGAVVRGLHHWGSSAMVVVVFAHMVAVFYLGAYKYPREFTWMIGVGLLVITLAFGFTGYLLPWDEKAYWATVVGTAIPGTVPVVGEFALRIMRGGSELGALTLTRFYSMHIMLLPASLAALVVVHLYLVIRLGVTVPPQLWEKFGGQGRGATLRAISEEDYEERYLSFKARGHHYWPDIVSEDIIAAAAVLVAIFGMMVAAGVPLEAPADPTNTSYVPRPEWYFMFLFQILKYFPGNLEWLGAGLLPPLGLLVLLFLPLIDRSPWRSPTRRPVGMAIGLLSLILLAYLTWAGYQGTGV